MRLATIKPANTGPSSRVIDRDDYCRDRALGRKLGEAGIALQGQHHTRKQGGQANHWQGE